MLLDLSKQELDAYVKALGFPAFRGKQIFDAMMQAKNLEEATSIPKEVKEKIATDYPHFEIAKKLVSRDGTTKFLIKLGDGEMVECVLMKYSYGSTICVSSQVGCRMGCKFCASTINGLVRNLTAGEILGQVLLVNRENGGTSKKRAVTNIVLMGMGEPLDNYDEVTKFLRLVSSKDGLNLSQRNITLSTCGLVPKIYKLADDGFSVTLTVSLHASSDEKRKQIMPIANAYSIKEILKACKYYFDKTGRRLSFEFTLIEGENDSLEEADRLAELVKGLPCHINVIPLNKVQERDYKGVNIKKAYAFVERLNQKGVAATKRRTMGDDIAGACGQLRSQMQKEKA